MLKVFHLLKWMSGELNRTILSLLREGTVQEVEIEGLKDLQLVSTRAIDRDL